nr:MAG TPA: hypothetical protein [Caudoviricetes sp.]
MIYCKKPIYFPPSQFRVTTDLGGFNAFVTAKFV